MPVRDVCEVPGVPGSRDAPAIDKDEGRIRTEAAKIDARRRADIAPGAVGSSVGRAFMGGASEVLRHGRQGFGDGSAPLSIDVRLGDDRHGGGAVCAPEVGSGDHDLLQFGRLVVFGADRRIDQYEDRGAALSIG